MSTDFKILNSYVDRLPDEPVDVQAAIRDIGIEYIEKTLNGFSGMIEKLESGIYRITVNINDSRLRKRFTAAHELGHYLFHRDLFHKQHIDENVYNPALRRDDNYRVNGIRPKHEVQANQFAANLLMPPKVVNKLKFSKTDEELASIFGVSLPAMQVRLGTYEKPKVDF